MLRRLTPTQFTIFVIGAFAVIVVMIMQPQVLEAVMLFVFLGLIPGTDTSIPPWIMFMLFFVLLVLTIRWLRRQPLYVGSMATQERTARQLARKKVYRKTTTRSRTAKPAVKTTRGPVRKRQPKRA